MNVVSIRVSRKNHSEINIAMMCDHSAGDAPLNTVRLYTRAMHNVNYFMKTNQVRLILLTYFSRLWRFAICEFFL